MGNYRLLGLAGMAALLQGCGGHSSSTSGPDGGPVATSKMSIYLRVVASDSQTTVVRANLNDGKFLGDSYRLDGGDFLRACVNGVCRTMEDNGSITSPDYLARFAYQPGVDHVVSFNRQKGQSAPDSHVTLPQPFTLVTPANHQQVTDGETVQFSWTPTGAPAVASLDYNADCTLVSGKHSFSTGTLSTDSNADGRETVSVDRILDFVRSSVNTGITGCSIDVTVSHTLQGRLDPGFHGGYALGVVSRQVNLVYVPR